MIAAATIAQRLQSTPLITFNDAVEATLKPLFPDVTVRQHPGRIDVSDIVEKDIFNPPMIAVATTRWREIRDIGGSWNLEIEAAAYVVTEDVAIGGKAVRRQEVGHALSLGLLQILGDLDTSRWGLQMIKSPEKVEARPLFTSETFAKGAAYYVVTWEQTLCGLGTLPIDRPLIEGITDSDDQPVDAEGPA